MASRQLALVNHSELGIEREEKRVGPRFARTDPLLIILWYGLLYGLSEAILASFLKGVPGFAVRVSSEILWIAPAFNLALFLLMGTGLWGVFRLRGKALSLRFVIGFYSCISIFGILLLVGWLHQVAALILSIGLGVQINRWARGREQRLLLFMRKTIIILAVIASVAGIAGAHWDAWRERRMIAALPQPRAEAPNILLITLDTLRADRLSSYGYLRRTTPHIDKLAQDGVRFENAFSNSSWTLPAHASLFTGRLPNEHRADWANPLDGTHQTLAEALSALGYLTVAFAANTSYVAPEWGLARGFSRFETYGNSLISDATTTVYGKKLALNLLPRLGFYDIPGRKNGAEINREFFNWLDQRGGRPFFAFLNYFDLHDPYITEAPYQTRFSDRVARGNLINFQFQAETFRRKPVLTPEEIQMEIDSYDGCIAYLDAQIGGLLAELARRGLDKNTLMIVTSDHGEAFGSHDLFGHGNSLYLETLRVPLVFYWPGKVASGVCISQVVGLNQIPSTLLHLLGETPAAAFPGQSLSGLLAGNLEQATTQTAVLSEVNSGRFHKAPPNYPTANGGLKSLVTDQWHFILCDSGYVELYCWRKDPQETQNLADHPELQMLVQQFKQRMEALLSRQGI